jgi:phospholipid/cholesterol/gamma-HCH transport system substrate-binding protein
VHLNRQARIQLAIFTVIALVALTLMSLHFMRLPAKFFGIGHYTVTVQLPQAGGLYPTSNVTYRGTEVGRVESVQLTDSGVAAVLSLKSDTPIPRDLKAEVHSQSAIGEQYIELLPRSAGAPPLKNGDVIALKDTSVPTDINGVLDTVVSGLQAVPRDNLKTVIDESYTAVGGLGPELSRLVKGTTDLSIDARQNLDSLVNVIDNVQPVLDSQTKSSTAITAWAAHLATITRELQTNDQSVAGIIDKGGPALAQARQLVDRLQPTLPILMANLVAPSQVALTYHNDVEQLLAVFPQFISAESAGLVANTNSKQKYKGQYLAFNLNLNLPPPCNTGFLPAQQIRNPVFEDAPERPAGDLYCRIPQDSPITEVRGARNTPCETRPGKRAPTVKLCESDQPYVPLNDGDRWKGDPNATYTGQGVPDLGPGAPPPAAAKSGPLSAGLGGPPPLAAAEYNPATGTYTGPDGKQYTQSDLAQSGPKNKSWQAMLTPPGS